MGEDSPAARLRSVVEGRLLCGPETLQINLTNRCNLNCIFCWNHSPLQPRRSRSWRHARLGDRHLDDILSALPRLRPERVLLSGRGEPLLHPRAGTLLERLREQEVPVTVQTNGVGGLEPDVLCALGVEHLTVNISAGTPAGYEATHPGRGHLFHHVVERLRRIVQIRGSDGSPRITLVGVIQRSNADEILPLTRLAYELGAEGLHLKGFELAAGLEALMLDLRAGRKVAERVEEAQQLAACSGLLLRAEHLSQVTNSSSDAGRFTDSLAAGPCYMGWYYLRVTCEGRVMFCCKDKQLGHLDHHSLHRIWRSPAYHLQRLAGRDSDTTTGLFDTKCRACSNFARNRELRQSFRSPKG